MAQKRISRARKRDLERPDEFITFASRILNVFNTHRKSIGAGFAIFLILLTGVLLYGHFRQKAEDRAMFMLTQTMNRYSEELGRQDAAKALEAVRSELETLLADYGDQQAGALAGVAFAQMQYRAGHVGEAVKQYEATLDRFPEGTYGWSTVWSGLGYARAAAGDDEKAIAAFSNIVSGSNPVFKADALYQMALLYRKTGRMDEFRKVVATLNSEYPDFMYAEVLPSPSSGG